MSNGILLVVALSIGVILSSTMLINHCGELDNLLLTAAIACPTLSWIVYAGQHGAFLFLAASLKTVNGKLVVDKMVDHQCDPIVNSAAELLGALQVTTVGKCLAVYMS
jgi:hypothetical protein